MVSTSRIWMFIWCSRCLFRCHRSCMCLLHSFQKDNDGVWKKKKETGRGESQSQSQSLCVLPSFRPWQVYRRDGFWGIIICLVGACMHVYVVLVLSFLAEGICEFINNSFLIHSSSFKMLLPPMQIISFNCALVRISFNLQYIFLEI